MKYKHIIWDWNGTLLNDLDMAIESMNTILDQHGIQKLDQQRYLQEFGFPVHDYYDRIGLNKEKTPFEEISKVFIKNYDSRLHGTTLHLHVEEVLKELKSIGMTQSILSASQEQDLHKIVKDFGIADYFTSMVGLDNHHARSKVERGLEWMKDCGIKSEETIMIGDTLHDLEVAKSLGCDCILVSHGHQHRRRLETGHDKIVDNLDQVRSYLLGDK